MRVETATGGVIRMLQYSHPNETWDIVEVYPETDRTRFYATRASEGSTSTEQLVVRGYLVGNRVPAPQVAAMIGVVGGWTMARRRR